jgi:hypothetical protein
MQTEYTKCQERYHRNACSLPSASHYPTSHVLCQSLLPPTACVTTLCGCLGSGGAALDLSVGAGVTRTRLESTVDLSDRPLLLPCCLPTARLPAALEQSSPPWSRPAAATGKDYPNSSINDKRVSLLQKGWIGYVSFLLYNYADE